MVKMLFEILPSHIAVPQFKSQFTYLLQLPANAHPEWQQVMAQVFRSVPPIRETQTEFWVPGWHLESVGADERFSCVSEI